jgi:hypothetical protein
LDEQSGKNRDHHELSNARSGDDGGVHKARSGRKRVRHDHANRRKGGQAAADGEHHAIEEQGVPGLRDQAHEPNSKRAYEHTRVQQQAGAHAVGEITGKVGGECRNNQKGADSESKLTPVPAELGHHGLESEANSIAGAPANEEDKKAGGEDDSRMHRGGPRVDVSSVST